MAKPKNLEQLRAEKEQVETHLVRHMAITHINQASRGKEQKADGTISSERHAD